MLLGYYKHTRSVPWLSYNELPILYYKVDDESNETICRLTKDNHILLKLVENGARKLHVFVDYDIVQPVSTEVMPQILYLPQSLLWWKFVIMTLEMEMNIVE